MTYDLQTIEASSSGNPGKPPAISVAVAFAISAVWFIPVNFVRLDETQTLVYRVALVLAMVAAVAVIGRGARYLAYVIVFFAVSAVVALLVGRTVGPAIVLLSQICAGYAVMRLLAGRIHLQVLLAVASVISLLVDWVLSRHVYAAIFPSQYFTYISGTEFRARGILGQPVPAAHLTISLLAYLYVLSRTLGQRRRLALRGMLILMAGVVVITTGTRSSIVLVGVLVLILGVEALKSNGPVAIRRAPRAMLAMGFIGITMVLSADKLATLRLFDFESLPTSDSFEVRSRALSTVLGLSSECDPCVVFGHGKGALAERLHGGAAISGVGTLDNMYLTTYWDYGLVGIALLALVGIAALAKLAHGSSDMTRAGAVGLLSLIVAFAFFDGLYVASGAFLFGLFLASLESGGRSQRNHGGRGGRRHASAHDNSISQDVIR